MKMIRKTIANFKIQCDFDHVCGSNAHIQYVCTYKNKNVPTRVVEVLDTAFALSHTYSYIERFSASSFKRIVYLYYYYRVRSVQMCISESKCINVDVECVLVVFCHQSIIESLVGQALDLQSGIARYRLYNKSKCETFFFFLPERSCTFYAHILPSASFFVFFSFISLFYGLKTFLWI